MVFVTKSSADLQNQEGELFKILRNWYLTPGLQRELRHKENEAVQAVLEILRRRGTRRT